MPHRANRCDAGPWLPRRSKAYSCPAPARVLWDRVHGLAGIGLTQDNASFRALLAELCFSPSPSLRGPQAVAIQTSPINPEPTDRHVCKVMARRPSAKYECLPRDREVAVRTGRAGRHCEAARPWQSRHRRSTQGRQIATSVRSWRRGQRGGHQRDDRMLQRIPQHPLVILP